MAVSTRVIKRRIKSVANTRKITKAMELVAASKMRKSVNMTQASRAYSRVLQQMVNHIRKVVPEQSHRLLSAPTISARTLVIVAASDRGLCGGFNAQLLKKTLEFFSSRKEQIEVVTVGRRAESAVRRAGYSIVASFEAISNAPSFERSAPVGEFAFQSFIERRADRVFIVYTDFKSALSQVPTALQLLPIIPEADLKEPEAGGEEDRGATPQALHDAPDILFEPTPQDVLVSILPRLLETQVYQSLLESSASEHSSRMMAMRSATDNATDMLQDLTFTFNQARQASITREISEISAGKAAIE